MMELLCPGENPTLFGFFDLTTRPNLLLYSYIPTIILCALLGGFVFLKNRHALLNKLLSLITLFFGLWVLDILVLWVASYNDMLMFGWQLTPILEIPIFIFSIYFTYVFTIKNHTDISNKIKIFFLSVMGIVFILLPTRYNIVNYDIGSCEGVLGYLWSAMYAFEFIAIAWIIGICLSRYRAMQKNDPLRKQIVYLGSGIASFLILFVGSNIAGEALSIQEISFIGSLGMVLFLGFLVFTIIQFKTFNIKIFATQALVWALWIMIGGILFVAQTDATRIVTAITEVIAVIFGFILIGSVRREVEQREKLEVLTTELSAANDRLEILDEQKTQFVSFASHDLKSPINIIKQFATLIADGTYKEPAKVQETIVKIKTTADRATQMVDDFLDIRKIEEGKMDYNFEVADIVSFVKGISEDYAPVAKAQKNIAVSFITTTPVIKVKMDSTRLRQVIQNYLNNSVKYTDPVKSGDHGAGANWIKVMVTDEQSTVLISVKDSGMGLSAELIPTLFEQFHRDKNTAKKIQGTGLGLYISKQIVLGHAGETWAQSDGEGKGSTFFVRLKKA